MPWSEYSRDSCIPHASLAKYSCPSTTEAIIMTTVASRDRGDSKATGKIKKKPVIAQISLESLVLLQATGFLFSIGKHPNLFHPSLQLAREIPISKSKNLLGWGLALIPYPRAPKASIQGCAFLFAPPLLWSRLIHSNRSPPCSPGSVSCRLYGQSFIVFKSLM